MMNNKTIRIQESTRVFIGIEVPDNVRHLISERLEGYTKYTKKLVDEDNWHITMLFIGEVENLEQHLKALSKNMSQTFLPTLSLTHIGKGPQKQQLWAFAQTTPLLSSLQIQLTSRINKLNIKFRKNDDDLIFIPHIRLADLRIGPSNGLLADIPMQAVWPIKKLNIYRSDLSHRRASYSVIGHINLST